MGFMKWYGDNMELDPKETKLGRYCSCIWITNLWEYDNKEIRYDNARYAQVLCASFAENEEVRYQSILRSSALEKCLTTLQYLCESVWQRLKWQRLKWLDYHWVKKCSQTNKSEVHRYLLGIVVEVQAAIFGRNLCMCYSSWSLNYRERGGVKSPCPELWHPVCFYPSLVANTLACSVQSPRK